MTAPAATIEDAITSRRSMRRFLPDPVSRETVEHLLAVASRAPSGTNIQPWQVYVIAGDTKAALTKAMNTIAGRSVRMGGLRYSRGQHIAMGGYAPPTGSSQVRVFRPSRRGRTDLKVVPTRPD